MPIVIAASLADVVAAGAVLIVVWACSIILIKPLAFLLSQIPVIGADAGQNLARGADAVVSWAAEWAKTAVNAMVQLISVPVTFIREVIGNLIGLGQDVVANIVKLVQGLGQLVGQVVHNAAYAVGQLIALAGQIAHLAAAVPGIAADVFRSLIGAVDHAWRAAVAAVSAALAAAVAAENALIAAVKGDLLKLIAGQVGVLSAAITAMAATLRAEWATDLGPINVELGQIGQVLAPILALDLTLAIPRILTEIETMRRECVDPMCNVLTPFLGALGAVTDVATIALVGGLAGEAIANPEGTARATAQVADEVHGLASDLFGLFTGARV